MIVFLVLFIVLATCILIQTKAQVLQDTEPGTEQERPTQTRIVIKKIDAKGRVSVAEIRTYYGVCYCEVKYDLNHPPQIHVLIVSEKMAMNVGHMLFRSSTEKDITHEDLMYGLERIRDQVCLPNIIPGYEKI